METILAADLFYFRPNLEKIWYPFECFMQDSTEVEIFLMDVTLAADPVKFPAEVGYPVTNMPGNFAHLSCLLGARRIFKELRVKELVEPGRISFYFAPIRIAQARNRILFNIQ